MIYKDLAALCIVGAITVACFGGSGWGWLLFVAVLCL